MAEAEFFGFSNEVEEFVADGGFSAAKLECSGGNWFGCSQILQHTCDLLSCGFVNVTCGGGVGEADRAFEVAPVRYVYYGKCGVRFVFGAYAAVLRAALDFLCAWVFYAFAVGPELLCTHVLVIVRPVEFRERSVLGAFFLDKDFAAFLVDLRVQSLEAFRTDGFCVFYGFHVNHLGSFVNVSGFKSSKCIR